MYIANAGQQHISRIVPARDKAVPAAPLMPHTPFLSPGSKQACVQAGQERRLDVAEDLRTSIGGSSERRSLWRAAFARQRLFKRCDAL